MLALQFGLSLMESCDEVMVCGNRMTTGMVGEIVQAIALKKRIVVFDENLHHEVMKLVLSNQGRRAYAVWTKSTPSWHIRSLTRYSERRRWNEAILSRR